MCGKTTDMEATCLKRKEGMGWLGNRVGLGNRKRSDEGERYKLACWLGVFEYLYSSTLCVCRCVEQTIARSSCYAWRIRTHTHTLVDLANRDLLCVLLLFGLQMFFVVVATPLLVSYIKEKAATCRTLFSTCHNTRIPFVKSHRFQRVVHVARSFVIRCTGTVCRHICIHNYMYMYIDMLWISCGL